MDAILLTAPDGAIFAANPAACALFGMTEPQICTGGRAALVDAASPDLPRILEERARTGRTRGELTFVRADGTRFVGEVSSVKFPAAGGAERTVMIVRDLTERREARKALADSQALLHAIVNSTSDLIWSVDAHKFGLLSYNNALERHFKSVYSTPIRLGMTPEELFPREDVYGTWSEFYRRALHSGNFTAEYSSERGGRLLNLNFNVLLRDGDAYGISVFGRDVTTQRRASKLLAESEHKYRSVVEAMAEGVALQAADGRILDMNPAGQRIQGRSLADMLGHDSEDPMWAALREDGSAFPGQEHPAMVTLRSGVPQSNVVMGIRRPDGERRWISINSAPIRRNGHPTPTGVVTTFHDITDLRAAQRQIIEYSRRVEATMQGLLQAVAHIVELKDPCTAGHQERVGQLAAGLAAELGWAPARCAQMRAIGLVHDVGKVALPSDLLARPSALSELEFEMVRTHSDQGFHLLEHVDFVLPIAEIVRQHHERMDGSGYPRGLAGDEIRIEARILAVADVIEAMVSHRPHRPALGLEAALREVTGGRGARFDADVVDALLRYVDRVGEAGLFAGDAPVAAAGGAAPTGAA